MTDKFTIALPVYKRTDYIKKALDSAVNQTVKCRILLIDNNSPHNDFKKIIDEYNNPLIEYIKTSETVHQDENFNNCIRYTKTPWLTILHDDDYLHCQYVEFIQKVMETYGDTVGGIAVQCFVGAEEWSDVNKKVELTGNISIVKPSYFFFRQLSPFPGVAFKKETGLNKLDGFNVSLHPIADFDFWRRLTNATTVLLIKQQLAYYRISPNQSTNHLIDAMINNVYLYRRDLINKSNYNKFLSKLGLEKSRINNIEFFKRMYENVEIPEKFVYRNFMKFARLVFKVPLTKRFIDSYVDKLSFKDPAELIKA